MASETEARYEHWSGTVCIHAWTDNAIVLHVLLIKRRRKDMRGGTSLRRQKRKWEEAGGKGGAERRGRADEEECDREGESRKAGGGR